MPKISIFVDDAGGPCLTIETFSGPIKASVALWVGNNSPGKFAGLKVKSWPAILIPAARKKKVTSVPPAKGRHVRQHILEAAGGPSIGDSEL